MTRHYLEDSYLMDCVILFCKNSSVQKIKNLLFDSLPGDDQTQSIFTSSSNDSFKDDPLNLYQTEFLNSLYLPNFTPHNLSASLLLGMTLVAIGDVDLVV